MRRPSLVTIALAPVLLALVGNLGTGTIEVASWWKPWIWAGTALAAIVTVIVEMHRNRLSGQNPDGRWQDRLDEAADQLALAVRSQWQSEEERRRIHDPFPLPVRWHLAPEPLMDHWANISRAPAGTNPGPLALEGSLDQIVGIYRRIPSGRLVVLGRAGSGKTILTLRFALDLLEARTNIDPTPVIFSVGSWNPNTTSLREWLTGQLIRDHPGLAAPGPTGATLAMALVEAGRVLPILDGFDEIADGLHRMALEALNAATTMPLLLTSRSEEYVTAVAAAGALRSAAAIELDDLTVTNLVDYLPRTTRKSAAGNGTGRWEPVLAQLGHPAGSLATANMTAVLATPLMVALARTIYSDTPGRDAAELLDIDQFSNPEALEEHLLGAFIPSVYRHSPGHRRLWHWDLAGVERWLGYLAEHLDRLNTRDLAWWHLGATIPRPARAFAVGLMGGTLGALVGALVSGLAVVLGVGLVFGLAVGLMFVLRSKRPEPARIQLRIRDRGRPVLRALAGGLVFGLVFGVAVGIIGGLAVGLVLGFAVGLAFALAGGHTIGLSGGHTFGLEAPVDIKTAVSPSALLISDRKSTVVKSLAFCCGVGFAFGLAFDVAHGLALGVAFGLAFAVSMNAWGQWLILSRIWLPLTGRLPWKVVAFLEDASRRGVLRQAGAVYQFRHARLQDHLARRKQPSK